MKKCFTINCARTKEQIEEFEERLIKTKKFAGCEIFYPYNVSEEQAKMYQTEIQRISKHPYLEMVLHLPFGKDNNLATNVNLSLTLERFKKAIDFAHQFNIKKLTLHPGDEDGTLSRSEAEKLSVKNIQILCDYASIYDMVIMIENLVGKQELCLTTEEIKNHLNNINRDNCKFILDCGHYNVANNKKDLHDVVNELKDHLVHLHLSNNSGLTDQHAGLDMGNIDYPTYFKYLHDINYQGLYCSEVLFKTCDDLIRTADLMDKYEGDMILKELEEKKKLQMPTIALMYDFDRTLCGKDMQEYSFIGSVGMSASEFWQEADKIAKKSNMDRIIAYMLLMIRTAKKNNVEIKKESFERLGKDVVLLKGVKSWFKRINDFGLSLGVNVEHYIISSGLSEIINGTPIAKEFKQIYACEFHYNASGNADWPQQVINYTTKTQFIFRISKGVLDTMDDKKLNSYTDDNDRRIPYRNMIYIGDGLTDVPCMTVVKDRGGESIAIYHRGEKEVAKKLIRENRVNYMCKADYSANKELEIMVKKIINKMACVDELVHIHTEQLRDSK